MASIGQLVKAVAATSGLDESSVKLVARYVRESGYIFQRSTGAGAATMSHLDAAALLMGLNGSSAAKDAAKAVNVFSTLPLVSRSDAQTEHPELLDVHQRLERLDGFGGSLARLIDLCSSDTGKFLVDNEDRPYSIVMAIHFERPDTRGSIFVYEEDRKSFERKIIVHRVFAEKVADEKPSVDRSVMVSITNRTISAIAKAISQN